jgi:hypothetical protein
MKSLARLLALLVLAFNLRLARTRTDRDRQQIFKSSAQADEGGRDMRPAISAA